MNVIRLPTILHFCSEVNGPKARLQLLQENLQSMSKKTFVTFEFEGQESSPVITVPSGFNSIPHNWGTHARVVMVLETGSGSKIWGTNLACQLMVSIGFVKF